ncbi:NAD(P)H-quinone oxidoreductase subunit L [Forsythia ovata]|uniref:NAD(P)H-quinone oxidoreductase subunit L n=1 Tax=Forsythia ovata TaxID=205694 RepID=A0ABD1W8F0_9LAMI
MSCSICFHIPKALPSLSPSHHSTNPSFSITCNLKQFQNFNSKQVLYNPFLDICFQIPKTIMNFKLSSYVNDRQAQEFCSKSIRKFCIKQSGLAIQVGTILATVVEPALAVTGVNDEEDLLWVLIQLGISAFLYFIVAPPIILNWLRIRWYKRNLLEMYVQFMFVFMFYPGVLLWAPFLNFRKFPRDPSMKYPWSTPQNPSQIKGGFLKYPWAQPEDYE